MRIIFILMFFITVSGQLNAQNDPFLLGMTLGGGEINENQLPGNLNEHYQYPTEDEIDYYYQKGFRLITIPFRWERVQKTLGGDLDYGEIGEIRKVVSWAANRDMQVILSMYNGGRYRKYGVDYIVGSYSVSRQDFADCWNKIANAFSGYPNIYGYNFKKDQSRKSFFPLSKNIYSFDAIINSNINFQVMELKKKIGEFLTFLKNDLLRKISKMFIKMFDCCRE